MTPEAVRRGGLWRVGATVAGWFVRPGALMGQGPPRSVARAPLEEPVVLTAGDAHALGVGAAVALALAGNGIAVLACWRVPAAARRRNGFAVARARRLVTSLEARGVRATAAGRLVVVTLPEEARDAVVLLRRVESASGAAVCLPLLGAARDDAWEAVLTERGAALLYGADVALLDLACAQLAGQGVTAQALATTPGLLARTLAAGGWTPPGARALRRAVESS